MVVVYTAAPSPRPATTMAPAGQHLADRHGFALLLPEQQRTNNPNLCFNWFVPDDIRRDGGEAAVHSSDDRGNGLTHRHRSRPCLVTGLSAGGAMTAVMLATYPEVFAGGAIIAGLPYGCAATVAGGIRPHEGARGSR